MLLQNNSYPQDRRVVAEAGSLTRAGYEVTVICPRAPGQEWSAVEDGVRCYRYTPAPAGDSAVGYLLEYGVALIATWFLTLLVLVRHGFDVIHAHNPPDLFVLIAAPYKLIGKGFVFDHHDLAPEMYQARFPDRTSSLLLKALHMFEGLTFRIADHVISTNDSYRQIAIERGGKDPARVRVVRNGPDLSRFRQVAADPELAAMGEHIIGYVGEMGVQDGIDGLLRSLRHLKEGLLRTDFYCVLIGDGSERLGLEHLAIDLGISDHVRFTGRLYGEELLRLLCAADICVCPDPKNPYTDASTMIKIAEYMALGKPVAAFDLKENMATAGEAAIYAQGADEVEFARNLAILMDDGERRKRMGAVGRERVESMFSWEHSVPPLLATYQAVIPASAKAPLVGISARRND